MQTIVADPSTIVASPAKKKKERYAGAVDCLRQVYHEKGFGGWYQVSSPLIVILGHMANLLRQYTRVCKHKSSRRFSRKRYCSESKIS